jgi:hypothetical protein
MPALFMGKALYVSHKVILRMATIEAKWIIAQKMAGLQ